jgi:hypothetical protein
MYAKLILGSNTTVSYWACYVICVSLLLETFYVVTKGRGAQRQVSMMYRLLMCDVLDMHISDMNCHYMIIKYDVCVFVWTYISSMYRTIDNNAYLNKARICLLRI